MANVQVANTAQYSGVSAALIPDTCGNRGQQNPQRYNLALLPPSTSNAPFKAYMPVSAATGSAQASPWGQFAASLQNASQTASQAISRAAGGKTKTNPNECVTKIIVSNFEGPITVTCTDVTPKCPNPPIPPMAQFPSYQPPMVCPKPFAPAGACVGLPREPREPYRFRRSHSKRKSSKKRSKSPRKERSHDKGHSEASPKEGWKKSSKSPPSARSKSPHLKASRNPAPPPPSTSTSSPSGPVPMPNLPPAPTAEQLQSAVLRPVQPRPRPYNIETAQTLLLPEPEKAAERERSKSPEAKRCPCHCVPMIYCMPSCPYHCHQSRSPRADRQIQRLMDICEGRRPIVLQIIKEQSRSHSLPRPKTPRDGRIRQHPSETSRRSLLSGLTVDAAPVVSPLKTVIRTSPPPQQPLHSQGLFGSRKGLPAPRPAREDELPSWVRRNDDNESENDYKEGKVSSHGGVPRAQTPRPPPPPPPPAAPGRATPSVSTRPHVAPKVGPKPTVPWPPRARPSGSDKPTSPPVIEYDGAKQISESTEEDSPGGGGKLSQIEGSYEVIWDYFSDNGGETDEEEVNVKGEEEMSQWCGVRFSDSGSYQHHGHRGGNNFEMRNSRRHGPPSGSYYNIEPKLSPKIILKVKRGPPT